MKTILMKVAGLADYRRKGYVSGIGRSTSLLLDSLSRIHNLPFNIKVYASGVSGLYVDYSRWQFNHFSFPVPEKFGIGSLSLEPLFRSCFVKHDLLHIPHNEDRVFKHENFVVTMHDVFVYDIVAQHQNRKVMERWERMAKYSRGIVTCSEFSKKEIVNRFHVSPDKIDVVYWGLDRNLFHIEPVETVDKHLQELNIHQPYFLAVSCSAPRKNVRSVLKAYRHFSKSNPDFQLVLVWGLIWDGISKDILDEYADEIKNRKIIILEYVSDDELRALYNGAVLTCFPTRGEGFGFPILESFACGTPVMTCRNTSLPEVGGDVALYVGEDNIDEMVDVMRTIGDGKYDMVAFKEKVKTHLDQFSWDRTARQYIRFYEKYL